MRRVQSVALELFERHGFDAVTVEQVAKAAGLGPATVYRNFGRKEQLALWDEYDPLLLEAVATALAGKGSVLARIVAGVTAALGPIYRRDKQRLLRRARLILKTPALRTQTFSDLQALKQGLAVVLEGAVRDGLARTVLAAAAVGALEAAIEAWVAGGGRVPLETWCSRAFAALASPVR